MKRTILTCLCALLTLCLSSCREDDGTDGNIRGSGLVTFTPCGGVTRSTQEGTFEKGDAIGVFALEPKTGVYWAVNNRYIYDGRAFRPATESDNIVMTAGTDFDFYVYSPFRQGQTDPAAVSHTAGPQSSREGWLAADFMTAVHTGPVTDYTVPLNFSHRLSTVEVRIERNDGVREAVLENVKLASRFNLLTGASSADDSRGSCAMYLYSPDTGGTTVFRATIPAQTLTSASSYVSLKGTTDMRLRGSADMTTREGSIHNYRIAYKKLVSITDYTPGGTTSGAGLYSIGSTCTVAATLKAGYEFAGWYEGGKAVASNLQYSFEVLTDRTLEPRYRNYGGWNVTLTANPSAFSWQGGTSRLVAGASRGVFVNGVSQSSQTAVPSISGGKEGFFLSGNTVTVSENNTGASRSCVFTASYGGRTATATITQEASPVSYVFSYADGKTSRTEYPDDSAAGSFILDINSYKLSGNSQTPLSWSSSGDSWIRVNGTSVTYEENPEKKRREGTVTLKQAESGKTLTLKVVQPGKTSIDIEK